MCVSAGVWAADSDDEDNEDNVRRRTRKPKDFSAPIGFVAGGVQQAGKKKDNKQGSSQLLYFVCLLSRAHEARKIKGMLD